MKTRKDIAIVGILVLALVTLAGAQTPPASAPADKPWPNSKTIITSIPTASRPTRSQKWTAAFITVANDWLKTDAVKRPISIKGKLTKIDPKGSKGPTCSIELDGFEAVGLDVTKVGVDCKLKTGELERVMRHNVGDQITVSGMVDRVVLNQFSESKQSVSLGLLLADADAK